MNYEDSDHAGGGRKNRIFDSKMTFEKGNYIAYFVTDDSHSYFDWNTSPPFDQDHWGITIIAADKKFDSNNITEFNETEDKSALVSIIRVRDEANKQKKFTLENDSMVRIYAIGEGDHGEMYDYGWIEDEKSGRVLWEMTYRMTDRAGGARKNRLYDDTISLKAGNYTVYYESDDSHSFNDWNATPPHDPFHWGITIYLLDE